MSHLNFSTMVRPSAPEPDVLQLSTNPFNTQPAPTQTTHSGGDDWALVHLLLDTADSSNDFPDPASTASNAEQLQQTTKQLLAEVESSLAPITSIFDTEIVSSQRPFLKHPNSFILPELLHQQQLQAIAGLSQVPSLFLSTPSPQTPFDGTRRISPSSKKDKVCAFLGCGKLARSRGLCMKHGGGRRCEIQGCNKGSQSGGRCIAHGGGKRCIVDDCQNSQQSDGLCITHGGGKRCSVPNCTKSSQRRGLCYVHGGGQKCQVLACTKGAQRSGLCVEHGGRRYCKFETCQKTARGGGYCITHGGDTRCMEADCNKIAKECGYCVHHRNIRGGLTPRTPRTPHTPAATPRNLTPSTPHTPTVVRSSAL